MYEQLDIFRLSSAMARHAAARQAMIATNLANADTPGFQARRLTDFATAWGQGGGWDLNLTRAGHLSAPGPGARADLRGAEPSPNGNTVTIEAEMLAAVDAQREHSRALAIWRHGITIMRSSLGR